MRADWSVPQRQSPAGILIIILKSVGEMLKRFGIFLLVILFNVKSGSHGKTEIMYISILAVTLTAAILRYFFFRFYLENDNLVVKEGWLNRSVKNIPLAKIQSVQINQSLLHRLFNVVELEVETAGSKNAEATITSLRREMAEALREKLLGQKQPMDEPLTEEKPQYIFRITGSQLARLSLSANHLETFILAFVFFGSSADELKQIFQRLFPGLEETIINSSLLLIAVLIFFSAIIVVAYSTIRVLLKYYDFRIRQTPKGYVIQSGLMDRKEILIGFRRMQFVSWHANWIRSRIGIYLMEFHTSGQHHERLSKKVHTPLISRSHWRRLISAYHEPSELEHGEPVRMSRSYFNRMTLLAGIIPSLALMATAWHFDEWPVCWGIIIPAWIVLKSWLKWKKFRLYLSPDSVYIKRSSFGISEQVLRWRNIQYVSIHTSPYLRSRKLASVNLHTAGGIISVPYVDKHFAARLADLAIYKVESGKANWM